MNAADFKRYQTFRAIGNTYENRKALKAMGCVWHERSKEWRISPAGRQERLAAIAAAYQLSKKGVSFEGVR